MDTRDFCINVISDHLSGRDTNVPDDSINWDDVISVFKIHELCGILYFQCKSIIPTDYIDALDQNYAASMYYYSNRIWLEDMIKSILTNEMISFITVKGLNISNYYPQPALRSMGDTDLAVHADDKERVHNILLESGFQNSSQTNNHEWCYYYDHMEIELHDNLIYDSIINQKICIDFFNDFWKYVDNGKLNWSFHFLFLVNHLRKHFMNRGVGIRQFLDIAVLTKNNEELDWEWIRNELIHLNLWEFAQRVFFLNSKWFGVEPPVEYSDFGDSFVNEATELILFNGVFGFDNEENDINSAINNVIKKNTHETGFRGFMSRLFPSYDVLENFNVYAYIRGHKYLLPVAWCHRAFRSIKNGKAGRNMKLFYNSSFVSKAKVQNRIDVFEKWGLD